MKTQTPALLSSNNSLPESWQGEAAKLLSPGESILAWFEPDLDNQLCFSSGLIAVTDKKFIGFVSEGLWVQCEYRNGLNLLHSDHAGVGSLELIDASGRIARVALYPRRQYSGAEVD